MITMRALLLAAVVLGFASPVLAGDLFPWWTGWSLPAPWACSAFELAHKCNAELNPHTNRCGCIVR